MKQHPYNLIAAGMMALAIGTAACNNNRESSTDRNPDTANDTSLTDTRRNSSDTTNYLTKDSASQSQETIDPNPPQNSRY